MIGRPSPSVARRLVLRRLVAAATACAVVAPVTPAAASATDAHDAERQLDWRQRIRQLVGDLPMSVAVGADGELWFRLRPDARRPPASNEKLVLAMALLDRLGADVTIPTRLAATRRPRDGVIEGDLWILGRGDPLVDERTLGRLADAVVAAGVRRVRGRVLGATTGFVRDWWATGWRSYFPRLYIPLPTALTFRGNRDHAGRHVMDPERRAARVLTRLLEDRGVRVDGDPGSGPRPPSLRPLAATRSLPMGDLVRRMNVHSRNFIAEVLGKYLGLRLLGRPSIPGGARAIRSWAAAQGVVLETYDASGLSYANRASALRLLRLLWTAENAPWGATLRGSLARGGRGTLAGRLTDVRVRAKTGTLRAVSALSGWVWSEPAGRWLPFSITSSGIATTTAKAVEDRIVRVLANRATDPTP